MNGYLLSTHGSETDVPVADAVETTISDNVYLTHALLNKYLCMFNWHNSRLRTYDDSDIEYVYGTALTEHKEAVNSLTILLQKQ